MHDLHELENVNNIISRHNKSKENLIAILLETQENSKEHYISEDFATIIAEQLKLPISKIYDVMTFYSMFNSRPMGKHIIQVCKSTSCHVNKSKEIVEIFEQVLGIKMGETTKDGLFTLTHTNCMGACDISPAAKIGEEVIGNLNREKIENLISTFKEEELC